MGLSRMWPFKTAIRESDAAETCVRTTLDDVATLAGQIREQLQVFMPDVAANFGQKPIQTEFGIAALAIECQAIGNLFPEQQARRLSNLIEDALRRRSPLAGMDLVGVYGQYLAVWRQAIAGGHLGPSPPHLAIASCLARRVGAGNPDMLKASLLGGVVMCLVDGYWKEARSKRLIP